MHSRVIVGHVEQAVEACRQFVPQNRLALTIDLPHPPDMGAETA